MNRTQNQILNKIIKEKVSELTTILRDKNQKYILAVSGGPDSQCLLKSFPHVVGKDKCLAVGVNHGLRPEADQELNFSEHLSSDVGIIFTRVRVTVEHGPSLQAQARNARYSALYKEAQKFGTNIIVTAHNFDDQAETVLIKLLRGVDPTPMGMVSHIGPMIIFRPLLSINRATILGYLNRWGVKFATDPSNRNSKYLRSWVRHELLPLMESKSPQIKNFLVRIQDFKDPVNCGIFEDE